MPDPRSATPSTSEDTALNPSRQIMQRPLIVGLCAIGLLLSAGAAAQAIIIPPTEEYKKKEEPKKEPPAKDEGDTEKAPSDEESKKEDPSKDAKEEDKPASEEKTEDADKSRGTSQESRQRKDAESKSEPTDAPPADAKERLKPEVEVYLPSVVRLIDASACSRSAALYRAFAGMFKPPEKETDESFDYAALLTLLDQIREWPDTSISLSIYAQDAEGRPCWAVRLAWPLEELRRRLATLIANEATRKVVGELSLAPHKEHKEVYELSLPDVVLAVITGDARGCEIRSTFDLKSQPTAFEAPPPPSDGSNNSGEKSSPESKDDSDDRPLIQCLVSGSMIGGIPGLRDVRFEARVNARGLWDERWKLGWNPFVGLGAKALFGKVRRPFEFPRESLIAAAFNVESGRGMADAISGLRPGTLMEQVGDDLGFALLPGTGFLPAPDIFYIWNMRSIDKCVTAIRDLMEQDARKRREDDLPPAWIEEKVADRPIFWFNPAAERGSGISPINFRTVIFFETSNAEKGYEGRLIVAQTSTAAVDTVRHWNQLRSAANVKENKPLKVPKTRNVHWQAIVHWRDLYALAQPWLSLMAGFTEGAELPPSVEELADALPDSVLDLRVEFAGLNARHVGPAPLGAAFVPAVASMALGKAADPTSEAAREQTACRNLRILHHHARLFHKDYGRWPATLSELDGYVDFQSHRYLLYLRPPNEGFLTGLSRLVRERQRAKEQAEKKKSQDEGESGLDESLYVVRWSTDGWRLEIRPDEFKNWETIAIDADGTIHRVAKKSAPKDEKSDAVEKAAREEEGESGENKEGSDRSA